jgi:NAD(P)-dependent dehydrogenase (short-subunit alcohol dehydrogenase family)
MQDFTGKVAFITGGASGVGLGQAKVFARAGARIVLADVRAAALDDALGQLRGLGVRAHGIHLDVTDRAAFARAGDETESVFGPVQLLFNTAGVSMFGPLEESTYEDYDWMMGVNFGGVVNGIRTFVPRMIKHGEGGYIVNTASMSGLIASGPAGIYSASKFAVVGLSQALRQSLDRYDIGVSVLCPGNVNTNIAESVYTRPAHLGNSGYHMDDDVMGAFRDIYSAGMAPVQLAEHAMAAMSRNQLYVIPYPEMRQAIFDSYKDVIDHRDSRRYFRDLESGGRWFRYETLLLPLSNDGTTINMIVSAISFHDLQIPIEPA